MGRITYAVAVMLSLVVVSCYNSFDTTPSTDADIAEANITISDLHTLYDTFSVRAINYDYIIRGRVTANDVGGNMYGSFIVESGGYAIEILDGLTSSHVRHSLGATVVIYLEGLAMSRYAGVLQVGLPAEDYSYYSLNYLTSQALVDEHIYIEKYGDPAKVDTYEYSELNERMCGVVISLSNLTPIYDDDEVGQVVRWGGYRPFSTANGEVIYTYTSTYADFAYQELSGTTYQISGVLQWGSVGSSDCFILKPRCSDDLISI
ncbi:MAG: DUF5689 domain-containing protein [Rikenellaceae bacterium]